LTQPWDVLLSDRILLLNLPTLSLIRDIGIGCNTSLPGSFFDRFPLVPNENEILLYLVFHGWILIAYSLAGVVLYVLPNIASASLRLSPMSLPNPTSNDFKGLPRGL